MMFEAGADSILEVCFDNCRMCMRNQKGKKIQVVGLQRELVNIFVELKLLFVWTCKSKAPTSKVHTYFFY